jgi:hypothetical protein
MTQFGAEALARHPSVEYVEQDAEVQASATKTNATWGLDRIDQRGLCHSRGLFQCRCLPLLARPYTGSAHGCATTSTDARAP